MRFEELLKYPFVLLAGFLVTYLFTPAVRILATRIGMVDQPRTRHTHDRATPTGGGIAVFLGFHAACCTIFLLPWAPFRGALDFTWWWHFAIISSILICVGMLDDRFEIKPLFKLAGQVGAALLAFAFDMRVGAILGINLPGAIDLVFTVLWFVTIINAFNLIDGMDGLATGLALIAAVGMAGSFLIRRMPTDVLILLGMIGTCLAFLRYNFHPASIFLGDSGSMFLGFLLASLAVSSGGAKATTFTTIMVPLLAVGIPIFDTSLAVWRRTVRRVLGQTNESNAEPMPTIFDGDVDHVHHRLLRTGLSHRAAAAWLYLLALGLVAVGLLSMMYHSHATGIYIIAFVAITYVVVRHLARIELWASGQAIVQGIHRPGAHIAATVGYPIFDVASLGLALAVGTYFSLEFDTIANWRVLWVEQLPLWVGVPFLCLFVVRTYSRVWSRAQISDFILSGIALMAGFLIATALTAVVEVVDPHTLVLQYVLQCSISVTMIAGLRALPRAIMEAMSGHNQARGSRRALLIGASPQAALYLMDQGLRLMNHRTSTHVVGFIDNNRQLHGLYVGGQLVHGGINQLAHVIDRHDVDMLVIIDNLNDQEMQTVTTTADRKGVDVYAWQTGIKTLRKNRSDL